MALVTHRRTAKKSARVPRQGGKRAQPGSEAADAIVHADLNMAAAALLYDMAALQSASRSQFGYKRAAKAIIGLPVSVADLVAAGALRDVAFIGPSSATIITEVVEHGHSPTGEAAVAQSKPRTDLGLRPGISFPGSGTTFAMKRGLRPDSSKNGNLQPEAEKPGGQFPKCLSHI